MKKRYQHKLSLKIILLCMAVIEILCITNTYLSYRMYKGDMVERYTNYADTILNISLDSVNAEKLSASIQNQKENETWMKLKETLDSLKENADIQYIYLLYFKNPNDSDSLSYVMNACTEEQRKHTPGKEEALGNQVEKNEFSQDMWDDFYEAYQNGTKQIAYIDNKTDDGEDVKTAYFALQDKSGKTVCIFCVDILLTEITNHLHTYIKTVLLEVFILAALFIVLLILLLEHQLIKPVKGLAESADSFVSMSKTCSKPEELQFHPVPIKTHDEIRLLGDSLTHMVSEIKDYMMDLENMATERERVNAQFQVVQELKENLFPFSFPAYTERDDFSIFANVVYCKNNGGDFYNFFLIDEEHLCFFTGTASGFGISTTMVAIITTIYMENYARLGYQPNRILSETNNRLSENNSGQITVSTFLGILNLNSGKLTYASAGELLPLIKCSGLELKKMEGTSGISLGSIEQVVYQQKILQLVQGDALFLYTEGYPLCEDLKGNQFSDIYVKEYIKNEMQSKFELNEIIQSFIQETELFTGNKEQVRDRTVLGLRYLG